MDRAVLAIVMTMTVVRVRRAHRAMREGPGKRREHQMKRCKGTGKRRGRGRQRRPGWVRGSETVKGNVSLNNTQGEMISLKQLLCRCRRKCVRWTRTRRAN